MNRNRIRIIINLILTIGLIGQGYIFLCNSFDLVNASSNFELNTLKTFPPNDFWVTKSPMPTKRSVFATAEVDGIIYTMGGVYNDSSVPLDLVEAYNPINDTWWTVKSMLKPRSRFSATVYNGTIYAINGANNFDQTVEAYNPKNDTWWYVASTPRPHLLGTSATANGTIYAIGAWHIKSYVDAYNPENNTWWYAKSMLTARQEAAATVLDGIIYVSGGLTWTDDNTLVEAYNPQNSTWWKLASLSDGRRLHGAISFDGNIIVVGGGVDSGGGIGGGVKTIEIYNTTHNEWWHLPSMPTGRFGLGVVVINNTIYAVGGAYKYLWRINVNVTETFSIPIKPWCDDIYYSLSNIKRTNILKIYSNGTDIKTPERFLYCDFQYRTPSGNWTDLTDIFYDQTRWVANFTTNISFELGSYDFRVRFKNLNNNYSEWFEDLDNVTIQNNYPVVNQINYSNTHLYRNNNITIFTKGTDIENNNKNLSCEIQFKSPSGNWTNLTPIKYITDQWLANFSSSTTFELGDYIFRARLKDLDSNYSSWFESPINITIYNNGPSITGVQYQIKELNRNDPLTIKIDAFDLENSESTLKIGAQYRAPSGSWIYLQSSYFIIDHWEIVFKPSNNAEIGFYDYRFDVTDLDGNKTDWYEDFNVVRVKNNIPEVSDISYSSIRVKRNSSITISIIGNDIENNDNLLICEAQFKAPSGNWFDLGDITYINNHWEVSFKPTTNMELGVYGFRSRILDLDGNYSSWFEDLNKITILNNNPDISNVELTDAIEDKYYEMQIIANDIESNIFNWNFKTNADWLNWDENLHELYGIPGNSDVGSFWVLINISDEDFGFDERNFTLVVLNMNDAPMIKTIDVLFATENKLYKVEYFVSDIDCTKDSFSWNFESNASWISWGNNNNTLWGVPGDFDVGKYWVRLNVTDGNNGFDEHYFIIRVININDPPKITHAPSILKAVAYESTSLNLTPFVSDIDNERSDLSIIIESEYATVNGLTIIFLFPSAVPSYNIRIIISDGIDNSLPHFITISVIHFEIIYPLIINKSPSGNNVSIEENITVTFSESMNRTSVENSFSISPHVIGEFNWVGNKLIYTPKSNLSLNTTYHIKIKFTASNMNGIPIENTYYWNYTTLTILNKKDQDYDGDGFLDFWEEFLGTDPKNPDDKPLDTDNDGKPNGDFQNSQIWMDIDDDNDGYNDKNDYYPLDDSQWVKMVKKTPSKDNIWIKISILILIPIVILLIFMFKIKSKINKMIKKKESGKNQSNIQSLDSNISQHSYPQKPQIRHKRKEESED